MYVSTFWLHTCTASLHRTMRSTGYAKHCKPLLWLVGFQQLWLVHFDPRCSGEQSILVYKVSRNSRPHRLMKTSSMQSKRRDIHPKWLHRETNDNTLSLYHDEQQQSFSWRSLLFFPRVILSNSCFTSYLLGFWESELQFTVIISFFFCRTLIIENFIPPDERVKLTNRASYDEENEEWKLKPSSQNGRWSTLYFFIKVHWRIIMWKVLTGFCILKHPPPYSTPSK